MPLSHQDQLMLLKDILSEHESECCGTVAEYEQLERLIQSLIANDAVNEQLKQSLESIYSYSQQGKYSRDSTKHINAYQQQLSQWILDLNTFS